MDEATSALDSVSEDLIQQYLREIRETSTIVIVAHRASTVREADKIVVIEDGMVIEEGDWDTLMAKSGVFARYQYAQSNA